MKATSQEKANCLVPQAQAPIPAPIPPATIKRRGALRHFDKSSGAIEEEGGESVIIISFLNLNPNLNHNLISAFTSSAFPLFHFVNAPRLVSGTSSTVASWLRCKART